MKSKSFVSRCLKKRSVGVLKRSSVYRLDPFLDKDGFLRVGGHLRRSNQGFVENTLQSYLRNIIFPA